MADNIVLRDRVYSLMHVRTIFTRCIFGAACILAALITASNCPAETELSAQPDQLIQAEEFYDNGKYNEAEPLYKAVIAQYPGAESATLAKQRLAGMYFKFREFEQAEPLYKELAETNPGSADAISAQLGLAGLYIKTGDNKQAKTLCETIINQYPSTDYALQAQGRLASLYLKQKKNDKAKALCSSVIEQSPGADVALGCQKKLAIMHIKSGDSALAESAISKLFLDYPDREDTVNSLLQIGNEYFDRRRYDQTEAICRRILDELPDRELRDAFKTKVHLVKVCIHRRDFTSAETTLADLLANHGGYRGVPYALHQATVAYYHKGEYQRAVELGEMGIESEPGTTSFWTRVWLARAYMQTGDFTKAESMEEYILSTYSDVTFAFQYLAGGYREVGRLADADRINQIFFAKWPTDKRIPGMRCHMAEAYLLQADVATAESLLTGVLEDYPDHKRPGATVRMLAGAYRDSGDYESAMKWCDYFQAKWPDHKEAALLQSDIVRLHVKRKDYYQAMESAEKLIADRSDCAEFGKAVQDAAGLFFKLRQYDRTVELCQKALASLPDKNALAVNSLLAKAYIKSQYFTDAWEAVEKIISNHSDEKRFVATLQHLGASYRHARTLNYSARMYELALSEYPDHKSSAALQSSLAGVYVLQSNLAGAEALAATLQKADPQPVQFSKTVLALADGYCTAGRYGDAGNWYNYYLTTWPAGEKIVWARSGLAQTYILQKDLAAAEEAFQGLLTGFGDDPEMAPVINDVARNYEKRGIYDKALLLHKKVYDMNAGADVKVAALSGTARCLVGQRDVEAVKTAIDQILNDYAETDGFGEASFLAIHFICDEAYADLGPKERELLKLVPGVVERMHEHIQSGAPGTRVHTIFTESLGMRASSYYALRDYAKAVSYYTELVDNHPKYLFRVRALGYIVKCHQSLRQTGAVEPEVAGAEILRAYETIVADYPDDPAAGSAQKWIRRIEKARKAKQN